MYIYIVYIVYIGCVCIYIVSSKMIPHFVLPACFLCVTYYIPHHRAI